jgi:hypothetical protein
MNSGRLSHVWSLHSIYTGPFVSLFQNLMIPAAQLSSNVLMLTATLGLVCLLSLLSTKRRSNTDIDSQTHGCGLELCLCTSRLKKAGPTWCFVQLRPSSSYFTQICVGKSLCCCALAQCPILLWETPPPTSSKALHYAAVDHQCSVFTAPGTSRSWSCRRHEHHHATRKLTAGRHRGSITAASHPHDHTACPCTPAPSGGLHLSPHDRGAARSGREFVVPVDKPLQGEKKHAKVEP